MGINRNIVECKFSTCRRKTTVVSRINRNIVECKLTRSSPHGGKDTVLIETLWNVNESNGTWHKSPKVGINRNIVECKYR